MKTRFLAAMNLTCATLIGAMILPTQGVVAFPDDAASAPQATEDVLLMVDGREMHGQILSETRDQIVFEYVDRKYNLRSKLTLKRDEIAEIRKDVPLEGGAAPAAPASGGSDPSKPAPDSSSKPATPAAPAGSSAKPSAAKTSFGTARVTGSATEELPSVYVVPVNGQMGTDIRSEVYAELVKDIREQKPDMIVLEVTCSDSSELMFPEGYETPALPDDELQRWRKREQGLLDFDDYLKLVALFRDQLVDVPQVVWIHDADGISATIIMAWPDLYMSPGSRLGGMISVLEQSGANKWADPDVRAKMMAAWLGAAKSFLEKGRYSLALADAMLNPETTLSGSWKGREVDWQLNVDGEYMVDGSDKYTANFTAKSAEDLCIIDGVASDLDDLALLLGYREYRLIEGKQKAVVDGYVEEWRRAFESSQKHWTEYNKFMSWASGEDAVKFLGQAKGAVEKIIALMDRYKAVEVRWERDFGVPKSYLITLVEQMKETLASLKNRDRGGRGGRTGGGGGGGGIGIGGR